MLDSFSISPVEPSTASRIGSLKGLGTQLLEQVKRGEQATQNDIKKALDSSGLPGTLPHPLRHLFQRLESRMISPEEQSMISTYKKEITKIYRQRGDIVRDGIDKNLQRNQIELLARAANKTASSFQQLLSSQQ